MKRIRLTIAYDGTNYCGWQIQPGRPTIEASMNEALLELLGCPAKVIGASRTDSGVHALGNVAVFDTESRIPAEKFCYALNSRLPEDIRVLRSEEVAPDWHPRKVKATKHYAYRICNREIPLPQERLYTYWYRYELDLDRMRRAAEALTGEHDFKSFCSPGTDITDTVRTIFSSDIERSGDTVTVSVSGNGFLYNMVRIIVGTLLRVGTGRLEPEDMQVILDAKDRRAAGETAPARGLTLMGIDY